MFNYFDSLSNISLIIIQYKVYLYIYENLPCWRGNRPIGRGGKKKIKKIWFLCHMSDLLISRIRHER